MRLIDADNLREAMYHKSFETDDGRQRWDGGLWIRYKVFEEAIDEVPPVEAELVRRGTWKVVSTAGGRRFPFIECSECGAAFDSTCVMRYCPDCGTPMDIEAV